MTASMQDACMAFPPNSTVGPPEAVEYMGPEVGSVHVGVDDFYRGWKVWTKTLNLLEEWSYGETPTLMKARWIETTDPTSAENPYLQDFQSVGIKRPSGFKVSPKALLVRDINLVDMDVEVYEPGDLEVCLQVSGQNGTDRNREFSVYLFDSDGATVQISAPANSTFLVISPRILIKRADVGPKIGGYLIDHDTFEATRFESTWSSPLP